MTLSVARSTLVLVGIAAAALSLVLFLVGFLLGRMSAADGRAGAVPDLLAGGSSSSRPAPDPPDSPPDSPPRSQAPVSPSAPGGPGEGRPESGAGATVASSPRPVAPASPSPVLDLAIGAMKSSSYFGVQIGAYPDIGEAERFVRAHGTALAGLRIHVVPTEIPGRGTWHRIRVGVFATRPEAEEAKRRLPPALRAGAIVVSYK